jgi:hypothetical protein
VHSINRLFFLSLGSVCFLIIPFFWLALAFDFSALENFVIALSHAEFVGYPIPELLGSAKGDTVVDKVSRIEIFFTIIAIVYSLFFVALSYLEGTRKRVNYCARGVAIPLFFLILGFWLKFIGDDHIISKEEKTELFQYTIGCFVISVMMFTYSFRSEKKVKPEKVVADKKNDADSDKEPTANESDASPPPEQDSDAVSSADPAPVSEEGAEEFDTLPPPESPATSALPPPNEDSDAVSSADPAPVSEEGAEEFDTLPPPESPATSALPPPDEDSDAVSSADPVSEDLIPPAADSGASSYQLPSEAEDPPDEQQEETDTSPKTVDEAADDPKPPPS